MAAPLTRAVLDRAQCSVPGCTHEDHSQMFVHGSCHPRAGLVASYHLARGSLALYCKQCSKLVAEIAVAP